MAVFCLCNGDRRIEMSGFFRDLSVQEETEFRQWARDNHTPGAPVNQLWHPVVRDECATIDQEAGL